MDYDWCLFSSPKTGVRGWRTGGFKPLASRKPCIPGGTFRWWPMYYMISLLIKLVRSRWLDILTHFVSRFREMRRSKHSLANERFARYGQRKALTEREFAHDAVKPFLQLRNSCEVTVTFYFRIPRNTLCLSPGFRIRFDPCWIPRRGFRILCPWNLDSRYQSSVDSRFLELYSRFQSPRFLILQAKISRILDYASKKSWIPQSVFPYLGRISYCFSNAPENMHSGSQEHMKIKAYAIFLFLE